MKMRCSQVQHYFSELADRSLDAEHEVLRHLAACAPCAEKWEQYQLLITRLGALPRLPDRDFRQTIHSRLQPGETGSRLTGWWRFLLPAAAVGIALFISWLGIAKFPGGKLPATETAVIQKSRDPGEASPDVTGSAEFHMLQWEASGKPLLLDVPDH